MKIMIASTKFVTEIDGVKVRLWEGETEGGNDCKVFVYTIAVGDGKDSAEFDKELVEKLPPNVERVDLRDIL